MIGWLILGGLAILALKSAQGIAPLGADATTATVAPGKTAVPMIALHPKIRAVGAAPLAPVSATVIRSFAGNEGPLPLTTADEKAIYSGAIATLKSGYAQNLQNAINAEKALGENSGFGVPRGTNAPLTNLGVSGFDPLIPIVDVTPVQPGSEVTFGYYADDLNLSGGIGFGGGPLVG